MDVQSFFSLFWQTFSLFVLFLRYRLKQVNLDLSAVEVDKFNQIKYIKVIISLDMRTRLPQNKCNYKQKHLFHK